MIFWAEDFNASNFKNYCSVIRLGEKLHQLDFFIVNADDTDAWMCGQYFSIEEWKIIFNHNGLINNNIFTSAYNNMILKKKKGSIFYGSKKCF